MGELRVWPGTSNVISGHIGFSVDVRSKTDDVRQATVAAVMGAVKEVCGRRSVRCAVERKHDAAAVLSDPGVMEDLSVAVKLAEVREICFFMKVLL